MFTITNDRHVAILLESAALPPAFLHYVEAEYEALKEALDHGDALPNFSLEAHGHRMFVLEPGDDCRRLLIGGPDALDLLETWPEYVELVQVSDEVSVYRACLMPDNDCFVLVYALKGALEPDVERWFAEQAGCLSEEAAQ